ncbi:cytochrome b5 [Cristinia sonorae]|uniref:Cytochrome b5 n=1 Tax=Cristinia sonorae TaxID=1940300 RepID=A0A8K0UX08_9AGAR|nr:cytochrome b5 [Cristinia sonorae]
MSWIMNPEGKHEAGPTKEDLQPKVQDPMDPNRMVSTKAANRPFLAYAEYRKEKEKLHEEWKERMKVRAEKLARGEEVGPEEPDPSEVPEVGCLGLLKFFFVVTVIILLSGKFFTGSYLWENHVSSLKQFIPTNDRLFLESGLAKFDGSVDGRPIYLAIDGIVYDVTPGKSAYGPGGTYSIMAGKDAARAYATGCFDAAHLTHDIRDLDEKELQSLNHWKKFYAESTKYNRVGRVSHPPIDPSSPVPEHCDPKKAQAKKEQAKKAHVPHRHEEL